MNRSPAAQQTRSRETTRRIVGAVTQLLSERSFEEITVADIARCAGISVGGFYARFASKEAVLLYLCDESFFAGFLAQAQELLRAGRWEGASIPDLLSAFHEMAVATFRTHRTILREVTRLSRTSADPDFRERVVRFNQHVHRLLKELLLARVDEIHHPDPAVAIDLGMIAVSALMREMILFGDTRPDVVWLDDRRLASELTRLYCGFLGVGDGATI